MSYLPRPAEFPLEMQEICKVKGTYTLEFRHGDFKTGQVGAITYEAQQDGSWEIKHIEAFYTTGGLNEYGYANGYWRRLKSVQSLIKYFTKRLAVINP